MGTSAMTGSALGATRQASDFADRLAEELRTALPRLSDAEILELADLLHECLRARRAERHLATERRLM